MSYLVEFLRAQFLHPCILNIDASSELDQEDINSCADDT